MSCPVTDHKSIYITKTISACPKPLLSLSENQYYLSEKVKKPVLNPYWTSITMGVPVKGSFRSMSKNPILFTFVGNYHIGEFFHTYKKVRAEVRIASIFGYI
jgi:hypothetical protein